MSPWKLTLSPWPERAGMGGMAGFDPLRCGTYTQGTAACIERRSRMPPTIRTLLTAFFFIIPLFALAQTETGFVVHGLFSGQPNQSGFISLICPVTGCPQPSPTADHVNAGVSFEGFVARRIVNAHLASLSIELPVLAMPNRGTN